MLFARSASNFSHFVFCKSNFQVCEVSKMQKKSHTYRLIAWVNLGNLPVPVSTFIARVWTPSLKLTITYIPDNFCLSVFGQGRNWSWHTNDIQWSLTFIAVPYLCIKYEIREIFSPFCNVPLEAVEMETQNLNFPRRMSFFPSPVTYCKKFAPFV